MLCKKPCLEHNIFLIFQGLEENQLIDDINKDLRILEELATLVLCIKDGITIEDIRNYVCPNIIPILEKNDIDHALAKLFEGTKSSYLMNEEPIIHVLKELEKTNLDKFMAITSILSKLPLNKEETLDLMIPKELLVNVQKGDQSLLEIIADQKLETVNVYY